MNTKKLLNHSQKTPNRSTPVNVKFAFGNTNYIIEAYQGRDGCYFVNLNLIKDKLDYSKPFYETRREAQEELPERGTLPAFLGGYSKEMFDEIKHL